MKKRLLMITIFILAILLISTSCAQSPSPSTNDTKYKVVFTADGKVCSTVLTAGGDLIPLPDDPEKDGFQFDGWYTDGLEDGEEMRFSATALVSLKLKGDLTVYAKWTCLHATLSDWIVDVTPTCKQGGSRHKDCLICSETVATEQMDKITEHTPAEPILEKLNDSDCTKPATYLETVYCSVCNNEISKTVLEGNEKGNHTPSNNAVIENVASATCTKNGSYDEVVYCSTCDDEISRTHKTTEKLPHTESDWIIKAEATCKEAGFKYKICSVCEEVLQSESIDKLTTHTYDQSKPVIENSVAASCYAEGSYDEAVYCSVCGTEVSRTHKTVPSLGHSPVSATENAVAATCTENGSYDEVVYCSTCDDEISRTHKTTEKLPHTESDWIIKAEATCKEAGFKYKICSVCEEVLQSESIDKLTTHTYDQSKPVIENSVAASCYAEGSYDEAVYCSVCGIEVSRASKVIPKTDHTSGEWIVDTAPTYEEEGLQHKECTVCGETTQTESIAKLERAYGNISYYLNGGSATEVLPEVYEQGKIFTLPTAVTRFSYRFAGWYLNPKFTGSSISQISAAHRGDITLYAKWEKAFSVLTFELGGGEMSGDSVIMIPAGGYTLPTDVTNGYLDFLGWYLEPDFQTKVTEISGVEGEDITVYARYREYIEPHKTFNNTSYQIGGTGSIQYGDIIAADPHRSLTITFIPDSTDLTSERSGYIRVRTRYLKNEVKVIQLSNNEIKDSKGNIISNYKDGAKIEIVLDFDGQKMRYYVNGVYTSTVTDLNFNTDLTQYNFVRNNGSQEIAYLWQYNANSMDSDFTIAVNAGDNYANNAQYHSITLNSEFGDDLSNVYNTEEGLVLPIPEYFGYQFIGWYENAIFSGDPITEVPAGSTDDYTFYAKWEKVIGFITYELNGGEAIEELPTTYTYNEVQTLPSGVYKSGATFVGWFMTPDFLGAPLTEIPAEQRGDITLYAKWQTNQLTPPGGSGIQLPYYPL